MTKAEISARFQGALADRKTLIMAHRGAVGANIVDNTLESFDVAMRQGADLLEIDVCASLDGDLFVMHDGMEPVMFGTDKPITAMTTTQVKELRYINKNNCTIDHPVNTFEEMLEHLKGRTLINLDRCWVCWDKVFPLVKRHGMADQIIFKSPPEEKYIDQIAAQDIPYMYMPVIWYPWEMDYAAVSGANLVAVEIIGHREDAAVMEEGFVKSLSEKGMGCLISAMTLGNPVYRVDDLVRRWSKAGSRMADAIVDGNIYLAAGHDDDVSVLGNPDQGWGWLVERGFNMLMTDWTLDMSLYLKQAGYRN